VARIIAHGQFDVNAESIESANILAELGELGWSVFAG
jgi:hypothetical protein